MARMRQALTLTLKAILPVVTIGAGAGVGYWLYVTKPKAAHQEIVEAAPAIKAVRLEKRSVCFPIRSQGTVQPRRETTLTARVAGQVEWVADCFDESGFFKKGEVLARIDRRDHEVRIQRLEATIRSAKAKLLERQQDLKRQQSLTEYEATTEVALQGAVATTEMAAAAVEELEAQLVETRNAVSDTEIVAPFDGCIQDTSVELGQFVTIGTRLASCFATDAVEVRLPVTGDEFAYLGLTLGTSLTPGTGPAVELKSQFAGRERRWLGNIVRSEAIIDSRSRMVYLVAQVRNPYADVQSGNQPLAVGMFVDATIRCPPTPNAIVLPEACVNYADQVFLVNSENRLDLVQVKTLRRERDWVVAVGDIEDGAVACATRLERPVPGMAVQIVGDIESASGGVHEIGGVVDLVKQLELATRPEHTER